MPCHFLLQQVVLGVHQPRVPGSSLPKNEGLEWRKGRGCLTAFYSNFQLIFLFRAHLYLQGSASSRALGGPEPSNPLLVSVSTFPGLRIMCSFTHFQVPWCPCLFLRLCLFLFPGCSEGAEVCNLPSLPGSPVCSAPALLLLAAAWFLSGALGGASWFICPTQNQAQMWKTRGQSRESLIEGVMSSRHLRKLLGEHLPKMFYFSFSPLEKRSV